MEMLLSFLENAKTWCRGRSWFPRLLLWLWFAWMLVHYLRDPDYDGLISGLNLGIHEFGHMICMPFGEFIGVAGGSFIQCLIPLISIVMFYRQEDYFAYAFSFAWLGTNLFNLSRYIGDAQAMELPLVTPFGDGSGEAIHDWNYLLDSMNLLVWDSRIAAMTRGTAALCMAIALAWGAWILWMMMRNRGEEGG